MCLDIFGIVGSIQQNVRVCMCVSRQPRDSAGLGLSDLDWGSQEGVLGVCLALMTVHTELRHPSLFLAAVFTIHPEEHPARVMRASVSIYDRTPHARFLAKDVSPTSRTAMS